MKKTLIVLLLLTSSLANAFSMRCDVRQISTWVTERGSPNQFFDNAPDFNVFTTDKLLLCQSRKGNIYRVELFEVGPEIFGSFSYSVNQKLDPSLTWLKFSCPLVSEKRLQKILKEKFKFKVAGLHVSAGALLTLKAGVSINERGAICFLGSSGLGAGGGVAIDSFTIK